MTRSTTRLIEALLQASQPLGRSRVDFAALDGLPPPVARYLRRVLRDGQPFIKVARLQQEGRLRTDVRSTRWLGFTAQQTIVPSAPGFVWEARVSVLPLIHVRVRDAYVGGTGSGLVSMLSFITLAAESGG
jgi:hypothetical protein